MHHCYFGLPRRHAPACHSAATPVFLRHDLRTRADYFANPSIEGMPKRLRLSVTPHVKRSSALRADERARVESNIEFSALHAVELSFERHPFGATASSRTRVPAAHHGHRELQDPVDRAAGPLRAG